MNDYDFVDSLMHSDDFLEHYGVKGMRWGKRSSRPTVQKSKTRQSLDAAKANKKKAYKEYSKAYDNYASNPLNGFTKKGNQKSKIMIDKAAKYGEAVDQYRAVKKNRKTELKKEFENIESNITLGEKMVYNKATRKKAAKYIVDNNMSMAEARKKANKEAKRNTVAILAVVGTKVAYDLYK